MPGKLTKKAMVDAEKDRISKLTNPHEQHFKIILSHQLESGFEFGDINRRKGGQLPQTDLLNIFRALGRFIDESIRLTMTEVENRYGRKTDVTDGTFDPETKSKVQVEHFCLFEQDASSNQPADGVRLHGYTRTRGGYFVVTKLDWFHSRHS